MKEQVRFVSHLLLHPVDGFWDMKHEKKGRLSASLLLLALAFFAVVFHQLGVGFLYDESYGEKASLVVMLEQVFVPFLLFCIANFSITTLMDGEGTFRDIVMAAGYSLTPIPLLLIPTTVLTHVLSLEGATYIRVFTALALVWTLLLLFCGMMSVHRFEPGKTIGILLLTVAAMAIIVFICVLFFSLISEIVGFVYTLFKEAGTRI